MSANTFRAVTFLLLSQLACFGFTRPAQAVKAEAGDILAVRYAVATQEGGLIATNRRDVAEDQSGTWVPGFARQRSSGPLPLIAGESGPFKGLGEAAVGMDAGDSRRVTLAPQEEFGAPDPKLVQQIPAKVESPLAMELPIPEFVARYNRFPAQGEVFTYNSYLVGTVASIGEAVITVDFTPRGDRFEEPFGTVSLEKKKDAIVSTLSAKVGSPFTKEGRTGIIVAAGADSFTVDFNHPLAGKPLIVDLQVEEVFKRSSLPAGEPDWIRDEPQALGKAAKSGKPLVLVLHSSECGNCGEFFDTTMNDPIVLALRGRFEWASVEAKSKPELERKYQIQNYPTILLMTFDGREAARADGFLDAQALWRLVMGDEMARGAGR